MNTKVLVLLSLFILPSVAFAQKAVLYKFNYDVPDAYRKQIIKYDKYGRYAYKDHPSGKKVPDVHTEQLEKEQIENMCESTAQLLKDMYNYKEVEILYQENYNLRGGRLQNFPHTAYKKSTKKFPADVYVEFKIKLKDKMQTHSNDAEELNAEYSMTFELVSELTVTDISGNVIDEKSLTHTDKLNQLLGDKYSYEYNSKGAFYIRAPYFTREDIISIYGLVKDAYNSAGE